MELVQGNDGLYRATDGRAVIRTHAWRSQKSTNAAKGVDREGCRPQVHSNDTVIVSPSCADHPAKGPSRKGCTRRVHGNGSAGVAPLCAEPDERDAAAWQPGRPSQYHLLWMRRRMLHRRCTRLLTKKTRLSPDRESRRALYVTVEPNTIM